MPLTAYPWHQTQWRDILERRHALPHALLIRGGEGIGKLDFARKLAQSVACDSPAGDGAACGECQSCRWFAIGTHPDYREVLPEVLRPRREDDAPPSERKPSQFISIDDVRNLHDFINLTARGDAGKTIVFFPAETLNVNAANALLKSLEEPPPATRFILVSHRPGYLPPTVLSRCQQLALPTPHAAAAEQWLREQGADNPALSLAHTGNAPLAAAALEDDEFWRHRQMLLDGLAATKPAMLVLAERVRDYPIPRVIAFLQRWTYDLLSVSATGKVRYNADYAKDLARIAPSLQATETVRYHRMLLAQQRMIHHPLNARLLIEQLLLAYQALLRGQALPPI